MARLCAGFENRRFEVYYCRGFRRIVGRFFHRQSVDDSAHDFSVYECVERKFRENFGVFARLKVGRVGWVFQNAHNLFDYAFADVCGDCGGVRGAFGAGFGRVGNGFYLLENGVNRFAESLRIRRLRAVFARRFRRGDGGRGGVRGFGQSDFFERFYRFGDLVFFCLFEPQFVAVRYFSEGERVGKERFLFLVVRAAAQFGYERI